MYTPVKTVLVKPEAFAGLEKSDQVVISVLRENNEWLEQFVKAQTIFFKVISKYGLRWNEMFFISNKHVITKPRQIACHIMAKEVRILRDADFARIIGKDRATYIYSVQKIDDYLGYDKEFVKEYEEVYKFAMGNL